MEEATGQSRGKQEIMRNTTRGLLATRLIARQAANVIAALALAASAALAQVSVAPSAPEPIQPIKGSLVIVGGGGTPQIVWQRFMQLAGGDSARIVQIQTAAADADSADTTRIMGPWLERKPKSIKVFHTRNRDLANNPDFVKPLREATGVWFVGGVQSRITDAYLGTLVERELNELLERGGVIGGTSAGAAIMTKVMIAGGDTVARLTQGFGFLPGAIADQHFIVRSRQRRLIGALRANPGLVGYGIDERTALIVHSGRQLEVLGESIVLAMRVPPGGDPIIDTLRQRAAGGRGRGGGPSEDRALQQQTAQRQQAQQQRADSSQATLRRPSYDADHIAFSRHAQALTQPKFPGDVPPDPVVRSGTLVIVGGGGMPEGLWSRFIELAGGPDKKIVVVPTASVLTEEVRTPPGEVRSLQNAGATNVHVFHTIYRDRSNNDEKFLDILRGANAIWFGGGRQWHFVDSYQNTKAHQLMLDVLARGGVIGGSSAGASIQGDFMARGDPLGPAKILAPGYETGLGFLQGVAIDQHFTQRNRQPDMTSLMKVYPQLLGIALDERTAIIVKGSVAEVVGPGKFHIFDRRTPNAPVDEGKDYLTLTAGARYDLRSRTVVSAGGGG
jgi:cyanophycinase